MPDEPQHAVRDGDYRVIYVVGKKGLYKFFPDSAHIAMMKPVDVGAGEQGYMVGYGMLTTFPPAGGVRILIPTRNTSPGGVWVLQPSGWILKNGSGGSHPLPEGWDWFKIAASPLSGNNFMVLGHKFGGDITSTGEAYPDGRFVDRDDLVSPGWITNDGGDNWFPVVMQAPYLFSGNTGGWVAWNENVYLVYDNAGRPLIFALTPGIGNFNLPGLAQWWGLTSLLQVRGAAWDGTTAQGPNYFGNTDAESAYGLTFGANGEAVMSAAWGRGVAETTVAWGAPDTPGTLPVTGAHFIGTGTTPLQSLDTLGSDHLQIVGVGADGIYYSPNYKTTPHYLVVPNFSDADKFSSVASTLDGVMAVSSTGIYRIADIASGSTPELGIATAPTRITSSRQLLRQIVGGRLPASDVLDATKLAQFVVFDGDSWTTVDGPADAAGRNLQLSLTTIAVTEG